MAFTIISNPTAIGAQGAINRVNNDLSKTIRNLSTGLRINSAADDASGLAISEKLRGQISGLKVASRNAQDGISFLQTAEGAIGSLTNMVQRVRELAVQAGDPAYGSSDRVMLQTEIDQLLEEVDRVSRSAEFNSKKLLNGDASALWSATENLDVIVKGSTINGNYNLDSNVTPGTNNVYKSNIMSIGAGHISYDIRAHGGGIKRLDTITNVLTDANRDVPIVVGVPTVVGAPVATGVVTTIGSIAAPFSATGTTVAQEIVGASYSIEFEVLKGRTAVGTAVSDALRFKIVNLVTGEESNWYNADIGGSAGATGLHIVTNGKAEEAFNSVGITSTAGHISAIATLTDVVFTAGGKLSYISQSTTNTTISGSAGTEMGSYGSLIDTAGVWNAGGNNIHGGSVTIEVEGLKDKSVTNNASIRYRVTNMVTGFQSEWFTATGVNAAGEITVAAGESFGGTALQEVGLTGSLLSAGTSQIVSANFKEGDKYIVGASGKSYLPVGGSASTTMGTVSVAGGANVFYNDVVSNSYENRLKVLTAQMDEAGKVHYGSLEIIFDKLPVTIAGTSTVRFLGEGDPASLYTELRQIGKFTNADGIMILDNTQTLTIYGNNKQADISLEGSDTVNEFQDKLLKALVDDLDMGAEGPGVNSNLIKYITEDNVTTGGNQAVVGTFILQGATIGRDSKLAFSGSQALIAGLGLDNIQEGEDSLMHVTVRNAHTGETLGSDTISDGILRGIIPNVDIKIDQDTGSVAIWNDILNRLDFLPTDNKRSTLHLVNNPTIAAVGANEGQLIDLSIGRIDTVSLNLTGVNVLTIDDSQKTITRADQALESINKARAIMGAQMNRLEYTISNLDSARENMVVAESRIRDLDIAEASTMLASQQVILQSATAMLAQANQIPSYAAQLLQ